MKDERRRGIYDTIVLKLSEHRIFIQKSLVAIHRFHAVDMNAILVAVFHIERILLSSWLIVKFNFIALYSYVLLPSVRGVGGGRSKGRSEEPTSFAADIFRNPAFFCRMSFSYRMK